MLAVSGVGVVVGIVDIVLSGFCVRTSIQIVTPEVTLIVSFAGHCLYQEHHGWREIVASRDTTVSLETPREDFLS